MRQGFITSVWREQALLAFFCHCLIPLSLFPVRRWEHYNEAGNRLVAETVLNIISRHLL